MDVPLRSHRAPLLLALAILGFVPVIGIFPFGVVAWILAARDLHGIDAGLIDPSGRRWTRAACVCAIFATAWWVLGIITMPVTSIEAHG